MNPSEPPVEIRSLEVLMEDGLDITDHPDGINHVVPADDWTEDPQ